jgi:tetratricopeptide (TPR) repeat protein
LGQLAPEQQASLATARRLDPAGLIRRLRGDLDRIVMKALEREADRRYDSAAQLAADVQRYLRGEPVSAGPPGTLYQLGKLVQRHRLAVALVVGIVLSMAAGFVGTSLGLVRARQAEQLAREQAQKAELDAGRANREAEASRKITELLLDIFRSADPRIGYQAQHLTVPEVLDIAAARIRGDESVELSVKAQLMTVLGRVYRNMARYEPARALLEEALAIRRDVHGSTSMEVADSLVTQAVLEIDLAEYRSARSRLEEALATIEALDGPEHPRNGWILNYLGVAQKRAGDRQAARRSFERALCINEHSHGSDSIEIVANLDNLGLLLVEDGEPARGQVLFERALAIQERVLAADDPDLAYCLNNLAMALAAQGSFNRARGLFERALAIDRAAYGPAHPNVAIGLANLANLALESGDCAYGCRCYREARAIFVARLGPQHPNVARVEEAMLSISECGAESANIFQTE